MRIAGFDWDDGNWAKCQMHGVSITEIEHLFSTGPRVAPDMKHSSVEDRFLAVGRTEAGRAVFVVFTFRGSLIRPLSARYMHADEVRRYEESAEADERRGG